MKKHLKYLNYVIKHKWYVFFECLKRRLFVQAFLHDWSKFLPDEWFPYVNHFYEKPNNNGSKYGYMKPASSGDKAFDIAWLKHIRRNPHHWQHYTLAETDGSIKIFEMPNKYKKEMFADWIGANKAQGHNGNVRSWYLHNKEKILLGKKTREWIEKKLKIY